jgi:Fe2+ or Zn2+ uptake regulation protein
MKSRSSHEHGKNAERIATMLRDLKASGLKATPQRIAIIETFASDGSHPTAQELFDRLRARFPSMSFATVYNTLDALASAGLASTLRLGTAARFDPNTSPHHHAVCDRCGAVCDIPTESLAPTEEARARLVTLAPGFVVRVEERIFRGMCPACTKGVDASLS